MALLTALSALAVLGSLGVSLVNALFAPRLRPADSAGDEASGSLLIPARNEADNLQRLLPSLAHATGVAEVLVLDDASSDGTASVVEEAAQRDSRIRLLSGTALPAGWTGKNWACQQLADAATGSHLVFCDADMEFTGDAVAATLERLTRCDVLSALPQHRFSGWADAAIVPLVTQTLIVALLPLPLVSRVPLPGFSAATGQWLAFRANAYAAIGGHASVRNRVLEDVEIVRRAKASGLKAELALGHRMLRVRMYGRAGDVVEGFSKNLYPLMGGSVLTTALALFGFYLLTIHPFIAAVAGTWWILGALLGIRMLELAMLRGRLLSVLLHLTGALAFVWIAVRSVILSRRGEVTWKQRRLG